MPTDAYAPPTAVEVLVAAICRDREDAVAWSAMIDELQENGGGDAWRWMKWAWDTGRWPHNEGPTFTNAIGGYRWFCGSRMTVKEIEKLPTTYEDFHWLPESFKPRLHTSPTDANGWVWYDGPANAWLALIAAASEVPFPEGQA